MAVFWDQAPSNLVQRSQYFGGNSCPRLQVRRVNRTKKTGTDIRIGQLTAPVTVLPFIYFTAGLPLLPQKRGQQVPTYKITRHHNGEDHNLVPP
jgi:hypothetical protein